jgi:DNA-binding transcriptional LysR family regulator
MSRPLRGTLRGQRLTNTGIRIAARRGLAAVIARGDLCDGDTARAPEAWYHRAANEPLAALAAVTVRGHLRTNDTEAVRETVLARLGIALLPSWFVRVPICRPALSFACSTAMNG